MLDITSWLKRVKTDNLSFCQTTLNYTALRSWDVVPYMVSAQFNLIQNGRQVSEASFRLKGNGGLALNKWRSTETKINELVDLKLLNEASKNNLRYYKAQMCKSES